MRVGTIDLGGSHVTAASVVLDQGKVSIERRESAVLDPDDSTEGLLERIASVAAPLSTGTGWAVAIPGPFDYANGVGTFEGVGKFQALRNIDLGVRLSSGLGVRSDAVRFLNDASAYGIGEWAFGAARGHRRVICLTLGTGLGSVFLLDGREVRDGSAVPPDGHLHRVRFRGDPIEDFVSSRAIQAHYQRLTGIRLSVERISARARAGDTMAVEVLASAMRVLGRVLATWADSFGANAIVVGGAICQAWDLLELPLRTGMASTEPEVPVLVRSQLLDAAPLLGAAQWFTGSWVVPRT